MIKNKERHYFLLSLDHTVKWQTLTFLIKIHSCLMLASTPTCLQMYTVYMYIFAYVCKINYTCVCVCVRAYMVNVCVYVSMNISPCYSKKLISPSLHILGEQYASYIFVYCLYFCLLSLFLISAHLIVSSVWTSSVCILSSLSLFVLSPTFCTTLF